MFRASELRAGRPQRLLSPLNPFGARFPRARAPARPVPSVHRCTPVRRSPDVAISMYPGTASGPSRWPGVKVLKKSTDSLHCLAAAGTSWQMLRWTVSNAKLASHCIVWRRRASCRALSSLLPRPGCRFARPRPRPCPSPASTRLTLAALLVSKIQVLCD